MSDALIDALLTGVSAVRDFWVPSPPDDDLDDTQAAACTPKPRVRRVPRVHVSQLSPLDFMRDYVAASRPVILLGAADHWPAMSSWQGSMGLHRLARLAGDAIATVTFTPNGRADGLTRATLSDGSQAEFFVKPHEAALPFVQILRVLQTAAAGGDARVLLSGSSSSATAEAAPGAAPADESGADGGSGAAAPSQTSICGYPYLSVQNDNLRKQLSSLLIDLTTICDDDDDGDNTGESSSAPSSAAMQMPASLAVASEALGTSPDAVNIWIGPNPRRRSKRACSCSCSSYAAATTGSARDASESGPGNSSSSSGASTFNECSGGSSSGNPHSLPRAHGSVSSTHKDHYENLYTVITGFKRFVLMPPCDVLWLYERPLRTGRWVHDTDKCGGGGGCCSRHGDVACVGDGGDGCAGAADVAPPCWRIVMEADEDTAAATTASSSDVPAAGAVHPAGPSPATVNAAPNTPWICVHPQSSLPSAHPDSTARKYPLFKHATPIVADVRAGETLYLPALWYHQVSHPPLPMGSDDDDDDDVGGGHGDNTGDTGTQGSEFRNGGCGCSCHCGSRDGGGHSRAAASAGAQHAENDDGDKGDDDETGITIAVNSWHDMNYLSQGWAHYCMLQELAKLTTRTV